MTSTVGIFRTRADAARATAALRRAGVPDAHINVLTPGASSARLDAVPSDEGEQPGMGAAIGGVTGAAAGLAGGWQATALVSLAVPGIGMVSALGIAASAILGLAGAAFGVAAGSALEERLSQGIPKDELFLYEHALREGRTVVIVLMEDDDGAHRAHEVLRVAGAESLDAARDRWWLGLDPELRSDEPDYRSGFEAALNPEFRGRPYAEVRDRLRTRHPQSADRPGFRRGYDRGTAYGRGLGEVRAA